MEVEGFLGLCVYYRVWIKDFAMRADPLYELTRGKKQVFYWGEDQQATMDDLKNALTHAPTLRPLDYQAEGKIILSVDSSLLGWRAILQQEEELNSKKRHPSRYENGLWSPAEKKYDLGKQRIAVYIEKASFLLVRDSVSSGDRCKNLGSSIKPTSIRPTRISGQHMVGVDKTI